MQSPQPTARDLALHLPLPREQDPEILETPPPEANKDSLSLFAMGTVQYPGKIQERLTGFFFDVSVGRDAQSVFGVLNAGLQFEGQTCGTNL